MLTLPLHRRQLQRTVWVTLLAWVLALVMGVVNGCPIQPRGAEATASVVSTHGPHVDHRHDAEYPQHDGPTSDPGKAGCLKFCDDESSTVAKGTAAQPDLPGAAIMVIVDWRLAMPVATSAFRGSIERRASHGPPLVIRFLRLTI